MQPNHPSSRHTLVPRGLEDRRRGPGLERMRQQQAGSVHPRRAARIGQVSKAGRSTWLTVVGDEPLLLLLRNYVTGNTTPRDL